jgi:hypothetical protein
MNRSQDYADMPPSLRATCRVRDNEDTPPLLRAYLRFTVACHLWFFPYNPPRKEQHEQT